MTRRRFVGRGGRAALVVGTAPLAGRLAGIARSASSGIFAELAGGLRGNVVVRGASGYEQARVLYNTRFDTVKPRAVVFCESLADVQRTVRWARRHSVRIVPRSGGQVWVPGRWALPPKPHAVWKAGHWAKSPSGWQWKAGHWR